MALSDEDKKEVQGLITTGLGLPDGKTLTDVIGEQVNGTLNAYDKRKSGEAKKLADSLKALTEKVEAIGTQKDDADDDADAGAGGNKGKDLPPEIKKQMEAIEKRAKTLETDLANERKAREEEKAEREKMAREAADRARVDEIRRLAVAKDIGVDPESVDFLIDHLEHRGLVRLREDKKGYELQFGTDRYSGEPTWLSLEDGLKKFVADGPGKRFLPPVPGDGSALPSDRRPGGGGQARTVTPAELEKMSSAELEKAIAEGRLTVPQ